jgi:hypothetical protein
MRNHRNRPPPIDSDHYNPGVTAYYVGELLGTFGIPIVGLILLIAGLRQRSRGRRAPGYPPPGPYPYPPSYLPPQPPTYPPYGPAGYPAPSPRRSSGTALIVVGSILLGLGVLGLLGQVGKVANRVGHSTHSANVGQCVGAFTMRDNNFSPAAQDCSKPDSTLEVAARGGSSATCPDGKREGSDYSILFDGTTTLCLMLNLKQDECYSVSGGAKEPTFVVTSCDSSSPGIRVDRRIDGSTDATLCPSETKPVSYPSPARLYCLERLEPS